MYKQNSYFKQKINELKDDDLPFDESKIWAKLEERLDTKQTKIMGSWWRFVAAACLIFGILLGGFLLKSINRNNISIKEKVVQHADNQVVIDNKSLEAQNNLKSKIAYQNTKKNIVKDEMLNKIEVQNDEGLEVRNIVANDAKIVDSEQIKSLTISEIQGKKNVYFKENPHQLVINIADLPTNNEVVTHEKNHRRIAFKINIFPSLTTPNVNQPSIYAYGESPNQIKIKL